jgi:hypothetical protein
VLQLSSSCNIMITYIGLVADFVIRVYCTTISVIYCKYKDAPFLGHGMSFSLSS